MTNPLDSIHRKYKKNKARINREYAIGILTYKQARNALLDNALESIEALKMPESGAVNRRTV